MLKRNFAVLFVAMFAVMAAAHSDGKALRESALVLLLALVAGPASATLSELDLDTPGDGLITLDCKPSGEVPADLLARLESHTTSLDSPFALDEARRASA